MKLKNIVLTILTAFSIVSLAQAQVSPVQIAIHQEAFNNYEVGTQAGGTRIAAFGTDTTTLSLVDGEGAGGTGIEGTAALLSTGSPGFTDRNFVGFAQTFSFDQTGATDNPQEFVDVTVVNKQAISLNAKLGNDNEDTPQQLTALDVNTDVTLEVVIAGGEAVTVNNEALTTVDTVWRLRFSIDGGSLTSGYQTVKRNLDGSDFESTGPADALLTGEVANDTFDTARIKQINILLLGSTTSLQSVFIDDLILGDQSEVQLAVTQDKLFTSADGSETVAITVTLDSKTGVVASDTTQNVTVNFDAGGGILNVDGTDIQAGESQSLTLTIPAGSDTVSVSLTFTTANSADVAKITIQ